MSSASGSIKKLLVRDGPWCHFCGYEIRDRIVSNTRQESPTRDHIIPRALGGNNDLLNLRLAHKFCNSIRALGFAKHSEKVNAKYDNFLKRLYLDGYRRQPNYEGPVNHDISDIPPHLLPQPKQKKSSFFVTFGPLALDFKRTANRYWHVRLSIGARNLTGLGFLNE